MMPTRRATPAAGFSLLELLIAVAIAAILACIAVPSYQESVRRSQRLDARLSLLRVQQLQESYFQSHLRYATHFGDEATGGLATADRSDGGDYALSLATTDDGQGYAVLAEAIDGRRQAADAPCHWFSVDQTGLRLSADAAGSWSDADPHRCWG